MCSLTPSGCVTNEAEAKHTSVNLPLEPYEDVHASRQALKSYSFDIYV